MLNVALTCNIIRCISPKTSKQTDLYIPLETVRQRVSRGSSFKTYYVHTHAPDRQATWDGEDLPYKCHQVRPCILSRKSCPCRKRLLLFRTQFIALSYHMVSAAKVAQLLYWTPLEGNIFCYKSTLLCCLLFTPFDGMNWVLDQRISNAFAATSATSVQR